MSDSSGGSQQRAGDRETPVQRAIRHLWVALNNTELRQRRCEVSRIPCLVAGGTLADFRQLQASLAGVPQEPPVSFVAVIESMTANPVPVPLARVLTALADVDVALWPFEFEAKFGATADADRSGHIVREQPPTLEDIWSAAKLAQEALSQLGAHSKVSINLARDLFKVLAKAETVMELPKLLADALEYIRLAERRHEITVNAGHLQKGATAVIAAILAKEQQS